MNSILQKKLKNLPASPGVYFHKSMSGEVIYVGKAAVLKNRVRQYFQNSRGKDAKTLALVAEIVDTDWVETESEIDALFLENEMVKRYKPRYNVLLRDDKSQLFVRINMKDEWPHVSFTRNPSDDGAEYFGPFYNGYALKKALRYLRKIFPYYTREPRKVTSRLDEDLGLNPRNDDGPEAYKTNLRKLISYIKGNRVALARELEKDMKQAANEHQFELAANYRNKLQAMGELQRRVMFGDREFLDISKDKALSDLGELLGLSDMPKRIEGYDISHQSGKNVVASMVVFTNGTSDRSEYRKFKLQRQTNDDVGNMREVLTRRLSTRNLKSWGIPDLLLIDGGKGQLGAACEVVRHSGVAIPCVSVAKREEELLVHTSLSNVDTARLKVLEKDPVAGVAVWRDGEFLTVNLHLGQRNAGSHSRNLGSGTSLSPYADIIKLVQRIRDESHRFAVSYHTSLKRSGAMKSTLEDVPGIGPATRQKLIKAFGSMRGVQAASELEITQVVGATKAAAVRRHLS